MILRLPARRGQLATAAWAATLAVMLTACTYQKDVDYKPFFSGLEGAEMSTPPTLDPSRHGGGDVAPSQGELRTTGKDGTITLSSRNAQHLMRHIVTTLSAGERELFTTQVLSDQTRSEYLARGLDPGQAYDQLKRRERDIRELFRRMPLGEHSPNVIMQKIGPNLYRVRLTGRATDGLEWTTFDMVLEGGRRMLPLERDGVPVIDQATGRQVEVLEPKNWRLVWFGS